MPVSLSEEEMEGEVHLVVDPPGDDGAPVEVDGQGGVVPPVTSHHI